MSQLGNTAEMLHLLNTAAGAAAAWRSEVVAMPLRFSAMQLLGIKLLLRTLQLHKQRLSYVREPVCHM